MGREISLDWWTALRTLGFSAGKQPRKTAEGEVSSLHAALQRVLAADAAAKARE